VACRASERVRVPALVALFTGMRLSEVLALRWRWVDLDKAVISVREALAPTKVHGIRFKAPKSKAGRSEITIHACRFPCRSEELLRLHIQERDRIRAELATLRNLKEGPRSHFFARPSSRFVIGEVAPLNELQQINPTRL
jgi:integrase